MVSFCSGGDGAYTDPYRLYNLDVFEYDADSEMAIVSISRASLLSPTVTDENTARSTVLCPS